MPPDFLRSKGRLKFIASGLAGMAIGIKYEYYQCPSCGAQVVFSLYHGRNQTVRERVGDDMNH